MTGFSHDEGALYRITSYLASGANDFDSGIQEPLDAVDAGLSSDVVNAALARVTQVAVVLGHLMDDIAAKVDVAEGVYAEVENANEGQIRLQEGYLPRSGRGLGGNAVRELETSPLERAPADETAMRREALSDPVYGSGG